MENRTNTQRVAKFLSPLRKRRAEYTRQFFTCILMGLNGVVPIFFLERTVYFLEQQNVGGFQNLLIGFFIYLVIFELATFGTRKWGWVETETMGQYDIENDILKKYIRLNNNDIEKIGTGKLIGIITTGKITWLLTLSRMMMVGVGLIISTSLAFYMMLQLNSVFSFLFILLLIVVFIYAYFINQKMGVFREERYDIRNARMKGIVKILMSKNEILHSDKIDRELDVLKGIATREKVQNQNMGIYRKLLRSTPIFVMSFIILGFFWIGGTKVLEGTLELSQLVGITGALIIMQRTVVEAVNFFVDLSKDFINIEKMWDFFDNTPELEGYDEGKEFEYKKGHIQIENLTFAYDEGQNIFSNFDLNLDGGKIYALIGNSGSGKSTLAKLISGYLSADSGDIIIDGQKIRDVSLKSYYGNIGYLTQEPSVFDGTIIENLTYAISGDYDEAKLAEVITMTKCEFIYDFKNGLETEIGEKGIRLSGGQKQRLAIAKIMLKDPKIIILDEPTSALDSFSEEKITYAMNNLFSGRTVIVIAHRLQTVKHADRIFVFENGKITEEGNHKQLVAKKGTYNKMLELQSGF